MDKPQEPQIQPEELVLDPNFAQQIQKLHRLILYGRWLFVVCLWICIAPF